MIYHNILQVFSQNEYALSQKKNKFQSYTNTLFASGKISKIGHMFKNYI